MKIFLWEQEVVVWYRKWWLGVGSGSQEQEMALRKDNQEKGSCSQGKGSDHQEKKAAVTKRKCQSSCQEQEAVVQLLRTGSGG